MKMFRKNGFTLIELIVTLGSIALISAIVSPNIQNYSAQRRMDEAARQLAVVLMHARAEAVNTNRKIILSLSPNNHQYNIIIDNDGTDTITEADTTEATRDICSADYDVTLSSTPSGFNPIFRPNGMCQTGSIEVRSSSSPGLTAVKISIGMTGRIRIGI